MVLCNTFLAMQAAAKFTVTRFPDAAFVGLNLREKWRYCLIDVKRKDYRTLTPNYARDQHFGGFRIGWGCWSPLSVQRMDDKATFEIFLNLFAPYRG